MKKTIEELRTYEVREDERLLELEKETYFSISGEDKSRVHITTQHKAFIEKTLTMEDFEPTLYYFNDDDTLCHLEGYTSISHLRLKTKGNDDNNQFWYILKD